MINEVDRQHLQRCIELAEQALEAGDAPFGSVLVGADGQVLREDRNRIVTGNPTYHPEIELVRWATEHMTPEDRAAATVYTSGEHCPMCSAAHAWAGLGRIVYASSSTQLAQWLTDMGNNTSPIRMLSIRDVAPGVPIDGPVPDLAEQVQQLHRRHAQSQS